jgi:hypothetical protein
LLLIKATVEQNDTIVMKFLLAAGIYSVYIHRRLHSENTVGLRETERVHFWEGRNSVLDDTPLIAVTDTSISYVEAVLHHKQLKNT